MRTGVSYSDTYSNRYSDLYAYTNRDSYSHAYSNTNSDSHAYCYSNAYSYADTDPMHGQMFTHAEAPPDGDAETHSASSYNTSTAAALTAPYSATAADSASAPDTGTHSNFATPYSSASPVGQRRTTTIVGKAFWDVGHAPKINQTAERGSLSMLFGRFIP